ncbi:MAG: hypothetical protein K2I36_00725, partial [Ureaplasma sp.]|nr:hypothetical protein [Ureaplasma sp.]
LFIRDRCLCCFRNAITNFWYKKKYTSFASYDVYFLLTISKLLILIKNKQFIDIKDNFLEMQ